MKNLIEFSSNEIVVPSKLGKIRLFRCDYGFFVLKDQEIHVVKKHFCDQKLQTMTNDELKGFLGRNNPKIKALEPKDLMKININQVTEVTGIQKDNFLHQSFSSGYIFVNQSDKGEYILYSEGRVLGGVDWDTLLKCTLFAVGPVVAASAAFILMPVWVPGAIGGAIISGAYLGPAYLLIPSDNRDGVPHTQQRLPQVNQTSRPLEQGQTEDSGSETQAQPGTKPLNFDLPDFC